MPSYPLFQRDVNAQVFSGLQKVQRSSRAHKLLQTEGPNDRLSGYQAMRAEEKK